MCYLTKRILIYMKFLVLSLPPWTNGFVAQGPCKQISHIFRPANQHHSNWRSRCLCYCSPASDVALHDISALGHLLDSRDHFYVRKYLLAYLGDTHGFAL